MRISWSVYNLKCHLKGRPGRWEGRLRREGREKKCENWICVCVYTHRQLKARRALSIFKDGPLRTRRALSLFKDGQLRTRRALSLYKVYGDSALLVLNGTSLNSDSALLALNWRYRVCVYMYRARDVQQCTSMVEPCYNEDHGTINITLLYQAKRNKVGTSKITLL